MLDKVIILSKKINAVSEGAENLYYRLLVMTDDYGRFHADLDIIKGQVYTRRKISSSIINKRINELWQIGLIELYEHDGENYLEIVGFDEHQSFRKDIQRKALYPNPATFLKRDVTKPERTGTKRCPNIIKYNLSKVNKSKVKKKRSEKYSELAALLEKKIKERLPRYKFQGKAYLENWANTFRIMVEKKEATEDEIKQLIIWIFDKSDFWYKNILSADTLRKRFGRLWEESGLQREEEEEKKYKEWLGKK